MKVKDIFINERQFIVYYEHCKVFKEEPIPDEGCLD